ncbi:MAG: general secretion pathway protein D [Verrucomicrobia bacterium]|nr:MAG: general secretion pathway protein D [Verrucomicrobiota bacterium]
MILPSPSVTKNIYARIFLTVDMLVCQGSLSSAPGASAPPPPTAQAEEDAVLIAEITGKELKRRAISRADALLAIEKAEQLMSLEQYEGAARSFQAALSLLPPTALVVKERKRAQQGLSDASLKLAEVRISEGRTLAREGDSGASAEEIIDKLLLANPKNPAALRLKERLNTPGFYNPAVTGAFREDVEKVKGYLLEGRGFIDAGRFDLAIKRADQILDIDPYNSAARKLQEEANQAIKGAADSGYNEARSRALRDVQKAWSNPVKKYTAVQSIQTERRIVEMSQTEKLRLKIQNLLIPEIQFTDTPISQVADTLTKASRLADSSEGNTGVLVIANVPATPGTAPAAPQKTSILDLPPPTAGVQGTNPSVGYSVTTPKIPGFSLKEILDIVTQASGTKWILKQNRVEILPESTTITSLVLRTWTVSPFIFSSTGPRVDELSSSGLGAGILDKGSTGLSKPGNKKSVDPKEFLSTQGVSFNTPGSMAWYSSINKTLTVYHTLDMLDIVEALVVSAEAHAPVQVDIRAKFVEFSQSNLKELSFDWLLGPSRLPGNKRIQTAGGGAGETSGFPFVNADGTAVGQGHVTGGNRYGSGAISLNGIDSLLGVPGIGNPAALALAGALTDPQFQLVIRALNQRKDVDLLSSPSITASEDEEATIDIIREFRYPTEFSPPQIPQTIGNATAGTGGQLPSSIPVTPTTPTAFEKRETGVKLRVTPSIIADHSAINLNLHPEVTEFEGFVNYGSPIKTVAPGSSVLGTTATSVVLTENAINQPIFSVRRLNTTVTLLDGETIALGGLIREDVQKVNDKTPILGDIPWVGRLFRSNVDQHVKKNLTIFVTARIIDAAGQPLKATKAERESEEVPSLTGEKTLGMIR